MLLGGVLLFVLPPFKDVKRVVLSQERVQQTNIVTTKHMVVIKNIVF